MRIGIFSDTHANIEALTAVLGAFKQESVDKLVCLGDTVGYGASPNECCDLVREAAAFTILGNHDAAVAGRMDYSYYYDAARQALDLHASMLVARQHEVAAGAAVRGARGRADSPNGAPKDHVISFCHGSPINIEEFEYIFAPEQAARCLPEWERLADVTFIGHSHLCKSFALANDDVHEVVAQKFELRARAQVHHQRRLGRAAARLRQPRQLHRLRHRRSACSSSSASRYDIDSAAQKIFGAKLERNFGNRLFIGV